MKDYFSGHSKTYATFRPVYPQALYDFIFTHLRQTNAAWDCATGNGQVASILAQTFQHVAATDISQQQLDNAIQRPNIQYTVGAAEQTPFDDHQFDLITVGQALHWFDRDQFYAEVKRVGKPDALLAVWGYALLFIEPTIDEHIMAFYQGTIGPYWDGARKLVEDEYKTIEFPFDEIAAPAFVIEVDWSLDHLAGYFESWSATQKYIQQHRHSPVPALIERLKNHWPADKTKRITFPIFLRLGKI